MENTGFWTILLSAAFYGILHSILASRRFKALAARLVGIAAYRRYYRFFFSAAGAITLLPVLALAALLPDRVIYTIPFPWSALSFTLQLTAVIGLMAGVMQTGALRFVGIAQLLEHDSSHASAQPEKLIIGGLYRYVRHPLYTFSLVFLWLTPVMSWNILALNLAFTAYMLIGSVFEEQKLVDQFGQQYEEYRRKTPRIVPGIRWL